MFMEKNSIQFRSECRKGRTVTVIPKFGDHGPEGPASQGGHFGVWDGEEVAFGEP